MDITEHCSRHAYRLLIGTLALFWVTVFLPHTAGAATADDTFAGAVLRTLPVGIPAANCQTVGPALALVQTSKLNVAPSVINGQPLLLVTSCFSSRASDRSVLYLLSPTTGAVVTTIQTTKSGKAYAPGNGWAGLVLAPDRGVLYGCGDNGELYSIDYSVFTVTADGTLTAIPRPSGATSCSGLAWDPSNKTLYQSTGATIFHFNTLGVSQNPASFLAPAGCSVKGLAVVGGVLEIACSNSTSMLRVDKITGSVLPDHATVAFSSNGALADLECDPVTFAGANVDAMWSKIVATNQMQAFRVPGGTCGLPQTAKVFAPAACPDAPLGVIDPYRTTINGIPAVPKDTDGDGLWDCWEDGARWTDGLPGIDFDGNGVRDAILCVDSDLNGSFNVATECASTTLKDVFVEIDYMTGDSTHPQGHPPDLQALANVQTAFAAAPVDVPNGIRVHFQVDDAIPHTSLTALVPCTSVPGPSDADFDTLRASWFGTAAERGNGNANTPFAKRYGFRYMIFAHSLVGTGASGCAELPGDDAVIALAGFGPADPTNPYFQRGTSDEQAGTVMHELGHNLGLRHGGGDNVNCKPNYFSVMSYSRQLPDFLAPRALDYSRGAQPTLNESALSESGGVGDLTNFPFLNGSRTPYSTSATITMQIAQLGTFCTSGSGQCTNFGTGIDWNHDGSVSGTAISDVNKYLAAGCDGTGTTLVGFDDWQNLQYNARASLEFGSGARAENLTELRDKSAQQAQASFDAADVDQDGTPDAFGCGSTSVRCAIDIKPGSNPKVLSKGSNANVQVAILSSATFNAVDQVIRETLTLNGVGVKLNSQNRGTCSAVSITPGRLDLLCQFPALALPLGGNNGVLEGATFRSTSCLNTGCPTTQIRAEDFIIVVK
jgi:hypothetical protein